MTRVGPRGCPWSGVGGEGLGGPGPVGRWVQSLPTLSFLGRRMTAGGGAIVMGVCSTPAHARDRVVEMSPVPASFAMRRQTHQTERRARPCRVPACQNRRLTSPQRPGQCGLDAGACAQSRTSEPRRNGLLPRGQQPCPPAVAHLTSLMVSMSCSLPQTGFGPELHAEMVPSAIALPLAYAFPGCAITSTRMVWVLFVHPTCADPNPLAIFLLTLSVRVTKTDAVLAPAHSILSVTLTPAPLATSVAGDTSWICSSSGGEKKATAGPAGATAAIVAPPATATAARAFFVLNRCRITVVLSFGGQGARAADRVIDGAARPASTATVSGIAGTCQRKSKPLCTAKAVTPATAPAHRAGSGRSTRARHSKRPAAAMKMASSAAPMMPRSVSTCRYPSWTYRSTRKPPPGPVQRRVACPGPTPASGCCPIRRSAAPVSPDRSGEARLNRVPASARSALWTPGAW